jgi:cobalt-zinc-cadmium efflux system protein
MAHAHDHDHHSHDGHDHHGHAHGHHHPAPSGRLMILALALTLGFAFVEAGAGWWAGSLALLGDAGHMFTDSMALGLAAIAGVVARRPPSPRHSYGLVRVEALAALVNGVGMLLVVGWITWQAVSRLIAPLPVHGEAVSVVALVGLLINLAVAWLLSRGGHDLNTRAALLHVLGDLLGSVAALAAGLIILATGWTPIDPLLSMLISGLILASTLRLLRSVISTLLEGVPDGVSLAEIGRAMVAVPGVVSVHDLHIWSLASHQTALSAHVVMARHEQWPTVLLQLRGLLASRYGIGHSTLQPELPGENFIPLPLPGSRNGGNQRT